MRILIHLLQETAIVAFISQMVRLMEAYMFTPFYSMEADAP